MKAPIPRTGEQTEAIRAAVVSMGARAEGFRCREVENLGFTQSAVTCVIARYLKSGLLHRARISHRVIVGRHHGEIGVDSHPGATRFSVRLPISPAESRK